MPDFASVAGGASPYIAGAQALLGLGKAAYGFFDNKKAQTELTRLKTPFYKVQDEYFQNRNLAAQQAAGGLPSATRNYLTTEAQRGLGSSLGAIEQTGGGVNDVAKILDSYNNNLQSTAAQDAQAHTQYLQEFLNRNQDVAGQKNMQFAINEYQPYENKLKQLQQRIATNKQNLFGGFSDAIGGASAASTGFQNQDLANIMKEFYNNGGNKSAIGNNAQQQYNPIVPIQQPVSAMPDGGQQIEANGNSAFDYNNAGIFPQPQQ
jgi:hypothetical protein